MDKSRQQDFKSMRQQENGNSSARGLGDLETYGLTNSRSIENLFIWKESRVFVKIIYRMMSSCKDWGFRDQIQRASVSIMNNIAEGAESGSDAKFINFLNIAKGSCSEVRSMLYLCEDLGFCKPDERIQYQEKLKIITVGIVKLIDSLNNSKTR